MSMAAMTANASSGGCMRQPDRHGSILSLAALSASAPILSRQFRVQIECRRRPREQELLFVDLFVLCSNAYKRYGLRHMMRYSVTGCVTPCVTG
jgi:hypothetical protein